MKSEMSCITSKSSVSSSFLKRIGSKVLHVTTSVFLENKVSSRQLKSLSKPCFRQSKAFNRCLESSRFPITTRSCRCTCFIICVRNTSLPSSHGPDLHSDTTSVYFSIYPWMFSTVFPKSGLLTSVGNFDTLQPLLGVFFLSVFYIILIAIYLWCWWLLWAPVYHFVI